MDEIREQIRQFESESEKNQLQLIPQLITNDTGVETLKEFLRSHESSGQSLVIGAVYQAIYQSDNPRNREFLTLHFPSGIVPLKSERNIDYLPLQKLLAEQDFQTADSLTRKKLCELAGAAAIERKWIYFTEVEQFPLVDLNTIDRLWWIHSQGKFGFAVQREIWLSLAKDFSKLWTKIGWKSGNNWTQYPHQFTWDLSAPKGHLPLSNQIRGVRVIASLFAHPVWSNREVVLQR